VVAEDVGVSGQALAVVCGGGSGVSGGLYVVDVAEGGPRKAAVLVAVDRERAQWSAEASRVGLHAQQSGVVGVAEQSPNL
jgi:hypothetical protein